MAAVMQSCLILIKQALLMPKGKKKKSMMYWTSEFLLSVPLQPLDGGKVAT